MARNSEVHARRMFAGDPDAVRDARWFVADVLAEAHLDGGSVADLAALAVSELATNAVEHARSPFEVVVDVGDVVRIAVHDDSKDAPRMRSPRPLESGGRGLLLIDAISDDWGCDPNGTGKWVWCELPTGAGRSPA